MYTSVRIKGVLKLIIGLARELSDKPGFISSTLVSYCLIR